MVYIYTRNSAQFLVPFPASFIRYSAPRSSIEECTPCTIITSTSITSTRITTISIISTWRWGHVHSQTGLCSAAQDTAATCFFWLGTPLLVCCPGLPGLYRALGSPSPTTYCSGCRPGSAIACCCCCCPGTGSGSGSGTRCLFPPLRCSLLSVSLSRAPGGPSGRDGWHRRGASSSGRCCGCCCRCCCSGPAAETGTGWEGAPC